MDGVLFYASSIQNDRGGLCSCIRNTSDVGIVVSVCYDGVV